MAARLVEVKEQLNASLYDTSKPWTKFLANMEQKTGVNRLYLFVGIVAFTGIWLAFGFAAQLLCNAVGFLYPAYASIHAIESPQKDDDTKWLTYWVVFALFSVVEFFANAIAGYFPLYWLAKCILFVWLMIPTEFNGSLIIYKRIVKPYFLKNQQRIDDSINKIKAQVVKPYFLKNRQRIDDTINKVKAQDDSESRSQ